MAIELKLMTVAVHRPGQAVRILGGDDVLDGEDVVPGWTLPVCDLFSVRPDAGRSGASRPRPAAQARPASPRRRTARTRPPLT